jgi:hypothetical protein
MRSYLIRQKTKYGMQQVLHDIRIIEAAVYTCVLFAPEPLKPV